MADREREHTVVFADGLCSFQLAPGAYGQCNFLLLVGQYAYTVDGTIQASVVLDALPPTTVTLPAGSHTIATGRAQLRLHGTLNPGTCCGPPILVLRMPIRRPSTSPQRNLAWAGVLSPEGL